MQVDRLVRFMRRNAVLVSKMFDMVGRFPDFGDLVLNVGRSKRESYTKYHQFEDEFSRTESIDYSAS